MSKPVCVLISDIHFNLTTLPLASAATRQAIDQANALGVPLVFSGDMHDTKANLRGECVSAMIDLFKLCAKKPYVLIGNHDRIHEKSKEHSLNFLAPYATIIDDFGYYEELDSFLISYQHDPEVMAKILKSVLPGTRLIIHQGLQGVISGDYAIDKSAMPRETFKDFRTISGHYHTRRDIKVGRPRLGAVGMFSYVGNPYTLGFGEATDPEKGFQILMDDGTLEFVPTKLRKHSVITLNLDHYMFGTDKTAQLEVSEGELLWVKVIGSKEQLLTMTRGKIAEKLGINEVFKLDFIPNDTDSKAPETKNQTSGELLDSLIDSLSNTSDERKARLKELWKNSTCG